MWSFTLYKFNFFRQLVGLPKIQKPKGYIVRKEQEKQERARRLAKRNKKRESLLRLESERKMEAVLLKNRIKKNNKT